MAGKNKIEARDRESSEWFGEYMERYAAIYSWRRTKIRAFRQRVPINIWVWCSTFGPLRP